MPLWCCAGWRLHSHGAPCISPCAGSAEWRPAGAGSGHAHCLLQGLLRIRRPAHCTALALSPVQCLQSGILQSLVLSCCSAAARQRCTSCRLTGCVDAACQSTRQCQQLWPCKSDQSLHSVPQMEAPASVSILRGPAGKGLLAVGSADGHIYLVDPRAGDPSLSYPSLSSMPFAFDCLSCQVSPASHRTQCTAGAGGQHTITAHAHCLLALQVPNLSTPSQHMLGAWRAWMCGANSWPPAGMGCAWGRSSRTTWLR